MFGLGLATKIYVAIEAIDIRKNFDGLYGLVRDQLGQDPLRKAKKIRRQAARTLRRPKRSSERG
jgi:IS66 Orf2 like protein